MKDSKDSLNRRFIEALSTNQRFARARRRKLRKKIPNSEETISPVAPTPVHTALM